MISELKRELLIKEVEKNNESLKFQMMNVNEIKKIIDKVISLCKFTKTNELSFCLSVKKGLDTYNRSHIFNSKYVETSNSLTLPITFFYFEKLESDNNYHSENLLNLKRSLLKIYEKFNISLNIGFVPDYFCFSDDEGDFRKIRTDCCKLIINIENILEKHENEDEMLKIGEKIYKQYYNGSYELLKSYKDDLIKFYDNDKLKSVSKDMEFYSIDTSMEIKHNIYSFLIIKDILLKEDNISIKPKIKLITVKSAYCNYYTILKMLCLFNDFKDKENNILFEKYTNYCKGNDNFFTRLKVKKRIDFPFIETKLNIVKNY